MQAKEFSNLLSSLSACHEASEWAGGKDLKTVWETCERGDWLLWLCVRMIGKEGWPSRQDVVLAACDCAEPALRYVRVGEDRPRKAIETARAWARGEATIEEVRETRRAASDAAARAASDAFAAAYAFTSGRIAATAAYADATAYAAATSAYATSTAANAARDKVLFETAEYAVSVLISMDTPGSKFL